MFSYDAWEESLSLCFSQQQVGDGMNRMSCGVWSWDHPPSSPSPVRPPPPHIAWLVLVLLQTPQQIVLSGHKVIFPTASFPWRLRLSAPTPTLVSAHNE